MCGNKYLSLNRVARNGLVFGLLGFTLQTATFYLFHKWPNYKPLLTSVDIVFLRTTGKHFPGDILFQLAANTL